MIYVLTQYGQVFGTYVSRYELYCAVLEHIPSHLYGEYRVTAYHANVYGEMPVIKQLKEFME